MKRALRRPVVHVLLLWFVAAALGGVAARHEGRINDNTRMRDDALDGIRRIEVILQDMSKQLEEVNASGRD